MENIYPFKSELLGTKDLKVRIHEKHKKYIKEADTKAIFNRWVESYLWDIFLSIVGLFVFVYIISYLISFFTIMKFLVLITAIISLLLLLIFLWFSKNIKRDMEDFLNDFLVRNCDSSSVSFEKLCISSLIEIYWNKLCESGDINAIAKKYHNIFYFKEFVRSLNQEKFTEYNRTYGILPVTFNQLTSSLAFQELSQKK